MIRTNRFVRAALTALTAALMAGCAAHVCGRAPGFAVPFLPVYLTAHAAAVPGQAGRGGKKRALICALAALALLAGVFFAYKAPVLQLIAAVRESGGLDAQAVAAHSQAGLGISMIGAAVLGTLFSLMLSAPGGVTLALLVETAAVLCTLTVNQEIPVWTAVPGVAAGLTAFGLNGSGSREGVRPALAITAAVVTAAALLFVPAERMTWEPLENLAAKVRAVVDDYASFTEQRVAFSIGEKGYDHGTLIEDTVVSMLGGAANPTDDEVMCVRTDRDVLLRGTVRRTYTGYSWIDDQPKSRYLYYDFTHRGDRAAAFGTGETADNDAFRDVRVSVEMLEEGASTLFVPAHLEAFDMDLEDAVYYNTAGEIFLARRVQAGDAYALTARFPESDAALVAAARDAENRDDPGYAEAFSNYSALPSGIRTEVYNLAAELTKNASCAADKAINIREHLAKNYRYTLDGAYPELGRDFVSWFLLESKEGYCSYFASAMTVLCRASGLPARYVEGYFVRANGENETIVTGHNAHAWVEVYLGGLGWVAFDPTARAYEVQNGLEAGDSDDGGSGENNDANDGGDDDPGDYGNSDGNDDSDGNGDFGADGGDSQPPESGSDSDGPDGGSNDDSGNPPDDAPDDQPDDAPDDLPPENGDRKHSNLWWILLLIALAAAAMCAALWARKRLAETDPMQIIAGMNAGAAALILYRANLTLLAQYGLSPDSGETPEAFAARVNQNVPNADYGFFVAEVARSRYSGKPVSAEAVKAGESAYRSFLGGLRPAEKLRYALRRMLRGVGSTDVIP